MPNKQQVQCDGGYRYRDYVRAVVRTAPPLTPAQRDQLAALVAAGK